MTTEETIQEALVEQIRVLKVVCHQTNLTKEGLDERCRNLSEEVSALRTKVALLEGEVARLKLERQRPPIAERQGARIYEEWKRRMAEGMGNMCRPEPEQPAADSSFVGLER